MKVRRFVLFIAATASLIWFYFCLPEPLFDASYSKVIWTANEDLLSAHIASDEQWRFPAVFKPSSKYKLAALNFEDAYFEYHPGVNPASMARAFIQNWRENKVVSGGSTISMQVIRIARNNRRRTYSEKLVEIIMALRLEFRYSKDEIFELYAAHAPFGGNVVGLEAASWRYFGRSSDHLSWGEAALLAVLPNAPGLIHPGKNRELLEHKRNRLLWKLWRNEIIDSLTCRLACAELIPVAPVALPNHTPHLMSRFSGSTGMIKTQINKEWQIKANRVADKYHKALSQNGIHNLSILVTEVRTGAVKVYIGNSDCNHMGQGGQVDVIRSKRSTGSLLKPFLYAGALEKGLIIPASILADIPTNMAGFAPKNFDKKYRGAVKAEDALTASLNVPAVRLLRDFGLYPFYNDLKRLGLTSINRQPEHYGLTLVLGGAEASLWELVQGYSDMAFKMQALLENQSEDAPLYNLSLNPTSADFIPMNTYSVSSLYQLFEMLSGVNRPREQTGWDRFVSARKVAWKTGTSFGHRDAWAIGVTPEYVVGVWVGNASGEGRSGLTGGQVAAPVMFDVFEMLPETGWFSKPEWQLNTSLKICAYSGFRASPRCEETVVLQTGKSALDLKTCAYCQLIWMDETQTYQVDNSCYPKEKAIKSHRFVLSPGMEWFYRQYHPMYQGLPDMLSGCSNTQIPQFEILYPESGSVMFIPRVLDGQKGALVFEAMHRVHGDVLYWHLDGHYLGQTHGPHQWSGDIQPGNHTLTVIDKTGTSKSVSFKVND